MKPLAKRVFPEGIIGIDQTSMDIDKFTRVEISESFGHLSIGTQEQLAILTRLGFAQVLILDGKEYPIILDDQFTFSDDTRLKALQGVPKHISRDLQIIIFTCRPSQFLRLVSTSVQL